MAEAFLNQIVTLNTELTFRQAEENYLEYDVICTIDRREASEPRKRSCGEPPVVVVMGHVVTVKTSPY